MSYLGRAWRAVRAQLFLGVAVVALAYGLGPRFMALIEEHKTEQGPCKITYVVDGDSLEAECPGKSTNKARITGIDAPEIHGKCAAEKQLARQARDYLRSRVRVATDVDFKHHGFDKYGRMLVSVRLDGRDIADDMVKEKLARVYRSGARRGWCN